MLKVSRRLRMGGEGLEESRKFHRLDAALNLMGILSTSDKTYYVYYSHQAMQFAIPLPYRVTLTVACTARDGSSLMKGFALPASSMWVIRSVVDLFPWKNLPQNLPEASTRPSAGRPRGWSTTSPARHSVPSRPAGWRRGRRIYEGGGGVKGILVVLCYVSRASSPPSGEGGGMRAKRHFCPRACARSSLQGFRASAHSSIRSWRPGCRCAAGSVLIRAVGSIFRPCASTGALPNFFHLRRARRVQRLPPAVIGDDGQLAGESHGGLARSVAFSLPLVELLKARAQGRSMRRLHQSPTQHRRALLGDRPTPAMFSGGIQRRH